MRKLNIAFIGARGVIGTYSGIETYYEEVGSRLVERGHRVVAYCRNYFTPDVPSHRGVSVRRLPALRSKHLETLSHSILATLDCLPRGFDIVQYHAIGSAPLALIPRLLGGRTVVSVRGLDWQRPKWGFVARNALKLGEWAAVRCPTTAIVVSASLQRHYETAHGKRPHFIPNAVVSGPRRDIDFLTQYGLKGDDFIVFAARISPEKGLHDLLEAWRPLAGRGKKLLVAGGSSYTGGYIEQVKAQAGDDVIFLGKVDRRTMDELYSNCFAYILPSYMEGLSVGLLEAVSYGCCVLTSDIRENLEVVGDAALTFAAGDVEAMGRQLQRLFDEPELAAAQRAKVRRQAERQSDWDDVAERTEALYLELVGASRDGTAGAAP